jgi:hypothetical protein
MISLLTTMTKQYKYFEEPTVMIITKTQQWQLET